MSTQILRYLAAFIVGGILAGLATWKVQGWHYGEQIFQIRFNQADSNAKAYSRAMAVGDERQRKKDKALHEANQRAQRLALASADLRTAADRLQHDLDAARSRLPQATCEATRAHAATLQRVFGECTAEYRAMAERAAGHASDALMFDQAWPEDP